MSVVNRLFAANAQWASDVSKHEPGFFKESAKGQAPHTLWIGCADSRAPETVITGARPGDIFVNRNVANQFNTDDLSLLAVLKYAVDHLGVEHVAIVGHSNCGGAGACLAAALSGSANHDGPIVTISSEPVDSELNRWLEPLTRIATSLPLASVSEAEALQLVVEANVKAQVEKLASTEVIRSAWTKGTPKGQKVQIHGWVYDLSTGLLKDLNISRGPA
ncbi:carbonic anhydrase [Gymnopilus junonius]|uniref:Carbonic anhydrase n=1 Tax=Gymnopilus junonius TaxID=109634 RepID=A0A9P5P1J7_GYMJU|nr:carbonic anhydrase [Gymnopilus junonius]